MIHKTKIEIIFTFDNPEVGAMDASAAIGNTRPEP